MATPKTGRFLRRKMPSCSTSAFAHRAGIRVINAGNNVDGFLIACFLQEEDETSNASAYEFTENEREIKAVRNIRIIWLYDWAALRIKLKRLIMI